MGEKSSQSFWTTLPGILTAIAAVITALSGLIVALNSAGCFRSKHPAAVGGRAGGGIAIDPNQVRTLQTVRFPVPSVQGLSGADAFARLHAAHLLVHVTYEANAKIKPCGVILVSPPSGTPAVAGMKVTLFLSTGAVFQRVPCPGTVSDW